MSVLWSRAGLSTAASRYLHLALPATLLIAVAQVPPAGAAPAKPVVRSAAAADSLLGTPAERRARQGDPRMGESGALGRPGVAAAPPAGALGLFEVSLLDAALARTSAERTERSASAGSPGARSSLRAPLKRGEAP